MTLAALLALGTLPLACDRASDDATPARTDSPSSSTATRTPGGLPNLIVGPGGLSSLQTALDQVQPGQRIVVRAGTYPSNVETKRSGPVTIAGEAGAVLSGNGNALNGPRIVHNGYTVEGVEVRDTKEGLRVEGATGVVIRNLHIHHVANECVRFRYASSVVLDDALVHDCGLSGNGEGVYVGLAPEQQAKFNDQPDPTFAHIRRLQAYTVSEGVDVKENARAIVEDSEVWAAWDANSGAIDFRSDGNEAFRNYLHDNVGAGIRTGGDKRGTADDTDCDGQDCWGVDNVLRSNNASRNGHAGYKFMWGPQDAGCSNVGLGNAEGLYYYADGVSWRITGC